MKIVERQTLQLSPRLTLHYQYTTKDTSSQLSLMLPLGSAQASPGQALATAKYIQFLFPYIHRPEIVLTPDKTRFTFISDLPRLLDSVKMVLAPQDFKNHQVLNRVQQYLHAQYQRDVHEIDALLEKNLLALAFAGTPYGFWLTGEPEHIDNITPGALAHIHQTMYCQAHIDLFVVTAAPLYRLLIALSRAELLAETDALSYMPETIPMSFPKGFQKRVLEMKTECGWGAIGFRLQSPLSALVLYRILQIEWGYSPDTRIQEISFRLKRLGQSAFLYATFPLIHPEANEQEFVFFIEWLLKAKDKLDVRMVREAIASISQREQDWWEWELPIHAVELNDIRRLFFQDINIQHAAMAQIISYCPSVHSGHLVIQILERLGQPVLGKGNPYLINTPVSQIAMSEKSDILVLENEISIRLLPDSSQKILSIGAWTPYGSASDPPLGSGTTALLLALLENTFHQLLRTSYTFLILESTFHFHVDREYSWFRIDLSPTHLMAGLALLKELLTLPNFSRAVFDQERKQLLSQLNKKHFSPLAFATEQLFNTVFSNHPYGHMPQGRRHEILQITDEVVHWQYRDIFSPEKMRLLVTGHFEPLRIKEIANFYFGQITYQRPLSWTPSEKERSLSPRRGPIVLKMETGLPVHASGCLYLKPPTPNNLAQFALLIQLIRSRLPNGSFFSCDHLYDVVHTAYSKCQLFYLLGTGIERPEIYLQELFSELVATDISVWIEQAVLSHHLQMEQVTTYWDSLIAWEVMGLASDDFWHFSDTLREVDTDSLLALVRALTDFNEWTYVILRADH